MWEVYSCRENWRNLGIDILFNSGIKNPGTTRQKMKMALHWEGIDSKHQNGTAILFPMIWKFLIRWSYRWSCYVIEREFHSKVGNLLITGAEQRKVMTEILLYINPIRGDCIPAHRRQTKKKQYFAQSNRFCFKWELGTV